MIKIERDASLKGWAITDGDGDKSQVTYHKNNNLPSNPVYRVGMDKRQFIVVSVLDGNKRVNRLWLSDTLLKQLKQLS